jgi:hypothetical protein
MYLLLSGTPIRERGSVTEELLGAMTRPVPSLGDVTTLPRSVVAVVDRALAFDREDRFPDAGSMQLAVRAVLDELSGPDSRATLPPPSVEPMALSLRAPHADGRYKRPSIPTVRPVSTNTTPLPGVGVAARPSALSLYVTLGFAVGMSIVVAARLTVTPSTHTVLRSEPATTPLPALEAVTPAAPAVVASTAPPASASAAASSPAAPRVSKRIAPRAPQKPPSDPLSRRK